MWWLFGQTWEVISTKTSTLIGIIGNCITSKYIIFITTHAILATKLRIWATFTAWISFPYIVRFSPDFIKQKLKSVSSDIDEISDSLALLGTIPQYHMLSNEQCPRIPKVEPFPKSEPLEDWVIRCCHLLFYWKLTAVFVFTLCS